MKPVKRWTVNLRDEAEAKHVAEQLWRDDIENEWRLDEGLGPIMTIRARSDLKLLLDDLAPNCRVIEVFEEPEHYKPSWRQ